MVSFFIFVLLVAQAEHPDKSCLLQKPKSQPQKPQLLGVDAGPILVGPLRCGVIDPSTTLIQNIPSIATSTKPTALAGCNAHCQAYDRFEILFPPVANPLDDQWTCSCCSTFPGFGPGVELYEVVPIATMIGDPHIKTLDGLRYTLLSQGTFSLWHFKKVGVDWEVFTHYAGHQSFTKGLLLVDKSSGAQGPALEITAHDCQWRGRTGGEWMAIQNGDSLSDAVSSFIVARKDGPKGHNHVRLNMQTKDGPKDIAVLSISCKPQHHIDLQMVMKQRDDRQFVNGELKVERKKLSLLGTSTDAEFRINKDWTDLGGSAAAAEYLRTVDEALQMSAALNMASCSEMEEKQAKETCSKHLGAYVDQRNADNAAFFEDCVFDLCHGAGEAAAEITAELLASNQAIETMAS